MSNRILELDGLRAFAIVAVVLSHLSKYILADFITPEIEPFVAIIRGRGVNISFIISGFIITALLLREKQKTGDVSLVGFYIRRFFRIIPLLVVFLLALSVLNAMGYISFPRRNIFYSLFFLGNMDVFGSYWLGRFWFFGHTWTLAVDEQYYLVFPPLLVYVWRFRRRPMMVFLLIVFLASWSSKYLIELLDPVEPSPIKIRAFSYFRFIVVGVWMALYRQKIQRYLANTGYWVPILAVALILTMDLEALSPALSATLDFFKPIAYGVFVLWFIENPQKSALLRRPTVQWLATRSYGIYLWQQLFTGDASFYNGPAPTALTAIAGTLLMATLTYYAVEKPMIKLGRQLSDRFGKKPQPVTQLSF